MKEHIYIPAAFFEQFKDIFINHEDADKIYTSDKSKIMNDKEAAHFKTFTYNSKEFKDIAQKSKDEIKAYGDKLSDLYLNSGLTDAEVLARRERDGFNKLPEKKKTPEIIKFLSEIFSLFSNLLWLAGILAFIGFALTPYDLSNVK
jgi:magnesium-transporting ATPase (P-type)